MCQSKFCGSKNTINVFAKYYKNSSGDEISNVIFYDHIVQYVKERVNTQG